MKNKKIPIIVAIILIVMCIIGGCTYIYLYYINTVKYTGIISSINGDEVTIVDSGWLKDKEYINSANLIDLKERFSGEPPQYYFSTKNIVIKDEKGHKISGDDLRTGDELYIVRKSKGIENAIFQPKIDNIIYVKILQRNKKISETLEDEKSQSIINDIKLSDIPEDFKIQDAVEQGCFVITPDKIYNKNKLDSFINNTKFEAENRIEDKIRIAVYGIIDENGPSIYDLEYKILDEKYINSEQKEVNKATYTLIEDNSRIHSFIDSVSEEELKEYQKLKVNNDIPAEYYGINIRDESGIGAYSLALSLCAHPHYSSDNITPYKYDIEIARYSTTAEIVEMKEETIQGWVETNNNKFGYIYISDKKRSKEQGNYELGIPVEGYTSANIDNKKQVCIDSVTGKKYDTSYIETGDILICKGVWVDEFKTNFDTRNNPITVIKSNN